MQRRRLRKVAGALLPRLREANARWNIVCAEATVSQALLDELAEIAAGLEAMVAPVLGRQARPRSVTHASVPFVPERTGPTAGGETRFVWQPTAKASKRSQAPAPQLDASTLGHELETACLALEEELLDGRGAIVAGQREGLLGRDDVVVIE